MACIGCGLGVNADGQGRVDVDINGGLTCTGLAGDQNNAAGRGLGVKIDPATGNLATVGANGLYVPPPSSNEIYYDTLFGGSLGAVDFNGVASPEVSISIPNNGSVNKVFLAQAIVGFGADPAALTAFDLQLNNNQAGWFTPAITIQPTGVFHMPLVSPNQVLIVPPGTTYTFAARFVMVNSFVSNWQLWLSAWGGYGTSVVS